LKRFVFIVLWLLVFLSCNRKNEPVISFYYWKTIFRLTATEQRVLKENKVNKLYLRYFDIGLQSATGQAVPVAPIRFQIKPDHLNIVPVVFVANKVMAQTENLESLADKTIVLIDEINAKNNLSCQEIQIDCDWTLETRENYLQYIDLVKKKSNKRLSATIRLHQVKYFKTTKIPNVDSGVLMYYNMETIAADSKNSIYDRKIAQRYLKSLKKYPLHLDFALPVYASAVHIRNQKVIGLRSKWSVAELQKDQNFKQEGAAFFRVTQPHYKNGIYYEQDDIIKSETVTGSDLREMAKDLNENSPRQPNEIIFYDLDEFNIKNYEENIFKQVVSYF
jgi:hypothetical protein